jgi:hypothetical protein
LSFAVTLPQALPSRVQKAASLSGAHEQVFDAPHVCGAAHVPHEPIVRVAPQLSPAVNVPHVLPNRAHKAVSVSGVHVAPPAPPLPPVPPDPATTPPDPPATTPPEPPATTPPEPPVTTPPEPPITTPPEPPIAAPPEPPEPPVTAPPVPPELGRSRFESPVVPQPKTTNAPTTKTFKAPCRDMGTVLSK